MKNINLQYFAETGITTDLNPIISIDFVSSFKRNVKELQQLLGVENLTPMAEGTQIKIYRLSQKGEFPEQVGEGEDIPATEFKKKLANTITISLKKYRKVTSAELIQRVGTRAAINETDDMLVSNVQKESKKNLYTVLKAGEGTATGTNLQTALANLWGKLQERFEDIDATPVYFVNPLDIADTLGTSTISTQTAFGFSYIQNFLGLGDVIVSPQVEYKKPIATAKENLRIAYVPASGDVAQTFGLTTDETGLIGVTHGVILKNATVETLVIAGVTPFVEYADAVFVATISE